MKLVHTRTSSDVTTRCFGSFPFTSIPTLTLPGLLPCTTSTRFATGIPGSPRRPNYNQYNSIRIPPRLPEECYEVKQCCFVTHTRTSPGITSLSFSCVSPTCGPTLTMPALLS